jgi:hypothetical protein
MVVRRNDSRRRRNMVAEPTDASSDVPNASTSREKKKSKRDASLYAYGANRRSQLKTTDLIPKRVFAVSVLVMGVIVVFGLLNVLAIFAPRWESHIGTRGVDALALSGTGTLSAWFCSMLLGLAGLVCLQLFRLRKHRRDDYHGSYRMWLLMSVACFIGSIETATHLFTIVWPLTESLTKISIQQTAWLPLAIGVSILTLLIARTAFEIRESRAALTLIVTAWLALVAAGVFQLPAAQPVADQLGGELLLGNCFLLGVVSVFMATVIDARFVFLQAHGLIKPNLNAAKRKLAKAEKAAAKKPRWPNRN